MSFINSPRALTKETYTATTTVISQHIDVVGLLCAVIGIARLECQFVRSEGNITAVVCVTFITCYVETVISSVSKDQLEREEGERGRGLVTTDSIH